MTTRTRTRTAYPHIEVCSKHGRYRLCTVRWNTSPNQGAVASSNLQSSALQLPLLPRGNVPFLGLELCRLGIPHIFYTTCLKELTATTIRLSCSALNRFQCELKSTSSAFG